MNNNVSDIKRVCVYGVGGYFGGKIANAITTSGTKHEIYFIARGEHLNVIKREGIKVVTCPSQKLRTDSFQPIIC